MKQQSNAGSRDDDFDYMKYRKRSIYRDETNVDKTFYVQKKRVQNNNRFSLTGNSDDQDDEILIRETQAALKSLSGNWSETNSSHKIDTAPDSSVYPNFFDEKNGTKIMSPITTTAFNSNDTLSHRDYYCLNGKPKSSSQSKKPRLNESKYQSTDFNELVGGGGGNASENTDKLTLQSDKSEYEQNSEYRSVQSFSQSSAFHPPSASLYDTKKSNSYGSMSHSAYHYTDSSGYSTYSSLDMNASTNSSPERERPFGKSFTKDDDMNATDYKEYTTLQPAGVGSKAASVIQDVAREGSVGRSSGGGGGSGGGGIASVVVMNSMSNASVQNTTSTAIAASNERAAFLERPMAAFSPASSNKGTLFSH